MEEGTAASLVAVCTLGTRSRLVVEGVVFELFPPVTLAALDVKGCD